MASISIDAAKNSAGVFGAGCLYTLSFHIYRDWSQIVRRSTKAALFSGLVFPGLGHLYLRRYVRGLLLAAGTAALLYVFVSMAVDTAYDLVGKIESGEVQPDVDSISEMVSKESQNNGGSTNIATMALLALWVIGIADSYREGRVQEKAEAIRGEKKT